MAFGISFGKNKSKSSATSTVNKNESVQQAESGTKSTTGTTTVSGQTATQSAQQGTSTQQGTSQQQTTGQQTTQGSSTQFAEGVLGGLESTVGQLLGAIPTNPAQLEDNFDQDEFVKAGMEAGEAKISADLEQSLNSMFDQFGGRDDDNSMSALLANRLRGDAGAAMAGIYSDLIAKSSGIEREDFLANLSSTKSSQDFLGTVLGALKGGRATENVGTTMSQNVIGSTTNLGTTSQVGSEVGTSQQVTEQDLVEALNSVLKGTTTTTGTETQVGKNSSKGGGFSLGL